MRSASCTKRRAPPPLSPWPPFGELRAAHQREDAGRMAPGTRSKHVYDGKRWVYNTYEAWREQFPFWSVRTVQEVFLRLERRGVLESTQRYNKSAWDRTKWYALDEATLAALAPEAEAGAIEGEETASSGTESGAVESEGSGVIEGVEAARFPAVRSSEGSAKKNSARVSLVKSLTRRSGQRREQRRGAW